MENSSKEKPLLNLSFRVVFEIFLIIFLFVFLLKTFVLDFFLVSSESMEKTLQKNDLVFISKVAYFFGISYEIPYFGLTVNDKFRINLREPKTNEIVVFVNNFKRLNHLPINYFIKRVKLVPGDLIYYNATNYGSVIFAKSTPDLFESEFKPAHIPRKGQTIYLYKSNITFYKHIIENEGNSVEITDNGIKINNQFQNKYTFRYNHYFLEGDNSFNSNDSRAYGLVPEFAIIGKAIFIVWSRNPNKEHFFERFLKFIE